MVGEVEEVAVAGDDVVGLGGAGERDQIVVVGVRGDIGRVGRVGEDGGVGGDSVDERDGERGGDEPLQFGRARTSASSSSRAGLAMSSKRSLIQAVRICRGGPAGEIAADTSTLASRTARTRRYRRLGARRSRRMACSSLLASSIA